MSYLMDKHVLCDEMLFELKAQIEKEVELKMVSNSIDQDLVRKRVKNIN